MKKNTIKIVFIGLIGFSIQAQTTFIKTQSIALPLPGGNAPYNITSGLIDDDTFPDLVISTTLGDMVYWLKNDRLGGFTLQSPAIGTLDSAGGVAIADINNDGLNDVVSTSYNDGKLVWFQNDGLGNFASEQIISSTIVGPSQIYVRKIDADDTLDVCVSAYDGNEVIWFANDGFGSFGTKNIIDNTIQKPGAFAMQDIDGDLDIATIAYNDDRVNVFNNQLFTLSLDDNTSQNIGMYPNPVKDLLYFKGFNDNISITVFDVFGKNMLSKSLNINQYIEVSNFTSGLYFVKIEGSNESFKFIKD